MPVPLALAAGALAGGKALISLTDILGSGIAARAQKKAQGQARGDLTAGYSQAQGFQDPIYKTALGNYSDLSSNYAAGNFSNPQMQPYQFDPQSVFQDPEYQAQMQAGSEAINTGAQAHGTLFSGANDRDLTRFGQGLFANRSDALYNRGFDATNTAFAQNNQTNQNNFSNGLSLVNPLTTSANQLTDLSVGQGQDLANNSIGSGIIRANNINNTANALGKGFTDLGGIGADLLTGTLGKKK